MQLKVGAQIQALVAAICAFGLRQAQAAELASTLLLAATAGPCA